MVENWSTKKNCEMERFGAKKGKKNMGGTKENGWGLIRFNNLQVIKGKEDGSAVIQWVNL